MESAQESWQYTVRIQAAGSALATHAFSIVLLAMFCEHLHTVCPRLQQQQPPASQADKSRGLSWSDPQACVDQISICGEEAAARATLHNQTVSPKDQIPYSRVIRRLLRQPHDSRAGAENTPRNPWLLASKLLGPRGSSRLHVGDVGILHSHPGKGYRIESSWLHVGSLVGQHLRAERS